MARESPAGCASLSFDFGFTLWNEERGCTDWNIPLDFVRSSEEWGVEKPSPEFFARIVQLLCRIDGDRVCGRPC